MMTSRVARTLVHLQLALIRCGWINLLAGLLLVTGVIGWGWLMPHLQQESVQQNRVMLRAQKDVLATEVTMPVTPPLAQQRLAQFYDTLGDARFAEQQIKTLFAIAVKNGLTLTQAEYKSTANESGKYVSYQVLLPVKGGYAAIRAFCEQILVAIPFASLDELRFKRESIANKTLEAQLRLTLYLDVKSPAPQVTAIAPEMIP